MASIVNLQLINFKEIINATACDDWGTQSIDMAELDFYSTTSSTNLATSGGSITHVGNCDTPTITCTGSPSAVNVTFDEFPAQTGEYLYIRYGNGRHLNSNNAGNALFWNHIGPIPNGEVVGLGATVGGLFAKKGCMDSGKCNYNSSYNYPSGCGGSNSGTSCKDDYGCGCTNVQPIDCPDAVCGCYCSNGNSNSECGNYLSSCTVQDCNGGVDSCGGTDELDCAGDCGGTKQEWSCYGSYPCGDGGCAQNQSEVCQTYADYSNEPDACDCNGNVDYGCGCNNVEQSGCDEECWSTLEFDECDICGGDGLPDGDPFGEQYPDCNGYFPCWDGTCACDFESCENECDDCDTCCDDEGSCCDSSCEECVGLCIDGSCSDCDQCYDESLCPDSQFPAPIEAAPPIGSAIYGVTVGYTGPDNLDILDAFVNLLPYMCPESYVSYYSGNIRKAIFTGSDFVMTGGFDRSMKLGRGYIIFLQNDCNDITPFDIEEFEWGTGA